MGMCPNQSSHGVYYGRFGLRQGRSDILLTKDESLDATGRLLRFLQANGVETTQINPATLNQYLNKKVLILHIGKKKRSVMYVKNES